MSAATINQSTGQAFQRSQMVRFIVGVLMTALASGCSVGPDYQTPIFALPAKWSDSKIETYPKPPAQKPPVLSQWWRQLGDPVLNALIDEAVAGNLDVATAKARIREARANRRQAIGSLFPSLNGVGSATRQSSSSGAGAGASPGGASSGESTISNSFQAGFDASWELDLFGSNRRNVEAATYGVDAAEEQLRSTVLTLIGDVSANYVEARGYQARMALARHSAASQRATADLTHTKFAAGSASAVDEEKAKAQASSTEADIPNDETAYMQTVHRLSVLTGREPNALINRMQAGAGVIPTPRLPLPGSIPADVLSGRPDVRLAERQLAQATAQIGAAEAAEYPSVSLSGNLTTSASSLADLGKASTIGWSFGPSLNVPLFSDGRLEAAVDVSEARRDESFIALKSTVLAALQDVENAILSLKQDRVRVGRLADAATHAREASRLSHTLYETGTSSFLDVLDSERSLYQAEDALLQSRVSIATSYITLAKALGGGWDKPIDAGGKLIVDTNTGPHPPKEPVRLPDLVSAANPTESVPQ